MESKVDVNKPLTRKEFFAYMQEFEERIAPKKKKARLISRPEVIAQIGYTKYRKAVKAGYLTPIKGKARNSKVLIEDKEFQGYLDHMKIY